MSLYELNLDIAKTWLNPRANTYVADVSVTSPTVVATTSITVPTLTATTSISVPTISASNSVTAPNIIGTTQVTGLDVFSTNSVQAGTDIVALGNVSGVDLTASGDMSCVELTASNDVNCLNLVASANANCVDVVASGNIGCVGLTATGNIGGVNITASGNIGCVGLTASGDIGGVNITASNDLNATADVNCVDVIASGNIGGVDLTASGTMACVTLNGSGVATIADAQLGLITGTSVANGLILNRLTTAQRNAIAAPTNGTILYNSTLNLMEGRNEAAWHNLNGNKIILRNNSGAQVIADAGASTDIPVSFNNLTNYNGALFQSTATTVTVVNDGVYRFDYFLSWESNAIGVREVDLYDGTSKICQQIVSAQASSITPMHLTVVLSLAAGTIISIVVTQNSTGNLNLGGATEALRSRMSVELLNYL